MKKTIKIKLKTNKNPNKIKEFLKNKYKNTIITHMKTFKKKKKKIINQLIVFVVQY